MSSHSSSVSYNSSRTPTPTNQYSRSPSPPVNKKIAKYFYTILFSFLAPVLLLLIGLIDYNPFTFAILIVFFVFYYILFFTSNFYISKGGYPSSMHKFLSSRMQHELMYFIIIALLLSIPFIAIIILKFIINPILFTLLLIVSIFHFGYLFYGMYPFLH